MQLDPTAYRHFLVQGVLAVDGQTIDIFEPCHADDLPAGEAGKTALVERVRRRRGEQLFGRSDAVWERVSVMEYPPPDEMWEGTGKDLFPV